MLMRMAYFEISFMYHIRTSKEIYERVNLDLDRNEDYTEN